MEQRAFTMNLNMRQTIARCEKLHSTALLDPPIDQPDAVLKPQLCPGLRGGGSGRTLPSTGCFPSGPAWPLPQASVYCSPSFPAGQMRDLPSSAPPPHTHTSILWALGAPALLTAAASSSPALQDGCPSFQGKVPSVIPIADPRTLLLACRAGPSVNGLEEPSVAKRLRGTPERIELENYRLSVRQAEGLEEVPEETQAEHNLSSVLDTGTEEDAASRSVCGDCCLPGVGAMEP